MVRLSLGEVLVILAVLVLVFGNRVQSARKADLREGQKSTFWSPKAVTVVFALLLGGGYFFVRAIGLLLRMIAK